MTVGEKAEEGSAALSLHSEYQLLADVFSCVVAKGLVCCSMWQVYAKGQKCCNHDFVIKFLAVSKTEKV